jgi:hypothetical protein
VLSLPLAILNIPAASIPAAQASKNIDAVFRFGFQILAIGIAKSQAKD